MLRPEPGLEPTSRAQRNTRACHPRTGTHALAPQADPYVKLHFGGGTLRTPTHKKGGKAPSELPILSCAEYGGGRQWLQPSCSKRLLLKAVTGSV